MGIARAQAESVMAIQRVGASAVADTTPLMTAIYSDVLFQDSSLYAFALEHHRSYDLTLFAAPDLPWIADGLQRDGKQARKKISEKLREILAVNRLPHTVVCGEGQARTQSALDAIAHHCRKPIARSTHDTVWKWSCDTCADAECEHRLFSKLF
jgi:nicotinamide riboside kinase